MTSKQIITYGASVERSIDGSTWAEIPECKSVAIPTVETEYLDATNLDSANGFREYVRGLKDAGIIALSCGYTSDGYAQQVSDQNQADAMYYRTTLKPAPDQTTGDIFTFRGFPTPAVEPGGIGDLIMMTISIRTTGDVTWTAGS